MKYKLKHLYWTKETETAEVIHDYYSIYISALIKTLFLTEIKYLCKHQSHPSVTGWDLTNVELFHMIRKADILHG